MKQREVGDGKENILGQHGPGESKEVAEEGGRTPKEVGE